MRPRRCSASASDAVAAKDQTYDRLNRVDKTGGCNAEVLAAAYEALAAGDVPAVFAVPAEEIIWHISGRNALSADYAATTRCSGFQALGERSNDTFALDVHEIVSGDSDTVVALVTERATRDDAVLDDDTVHVWDVQIGKATGFRCFADDERRVLVLDGDLDKDSMQRRDLLPHLGRLATIAVLTGHITSTPSGLRGRISSVSAAKYPGVVHVAGRAPDLHDGSHTHGPHCSVPRRSPPRSCPPSVWDRAARPTR